jgi:hypothetical protein
VRAKMFLFIFIPVPPCSLKGWLLKKEIKDDAEYLTFPLLGGMIVQKQKLNVAQVAVGGFMAVSITHTHTHTHTIYIYMYMYTTHIYSNTYVYAYKYTNTYVCVCMHTRMYV